MRRLRYVSRGPEKASSVPIEVKLAFLQQLLAILPVIDAKANPSA